ncbi:MAG: hypothetical protein ACK4HB_07305 [Candidatus Bipolaricaulia bacterium]
MAENQPVEKPIAAFVLSLLAGLWMLAAGGMMSGYDWEDMGGWMWGHGMMRGFAPTLWWPWFGIIAGIVVLVGAAMLYAKPEQRQTWGIVILIASALNFFVGMGGLLAGVLGVIGGALALSKSP